MYLPLCKYSSRQYFKNKGWKLKMTLTVIPLQTGIEYTPKTSRCTRELSTLYPQNHLYKLTTSPDKNDHIVNTVITNYPATETQFSTLSSNSSFWQQKKTILITLLHFCVFNPVFFATLLSNCHIPLFTYFSSFIRFLKPFPYTLNYNILLFFVFLFVHL